MNVQEYLTNHPRNLIARRLLKLLETGEVSLAMKCRGGRGNLTTRKGSNIEKVRAMMKEPLTIQGGYARANSPQSNFLIVETARPIETAPTSPAKP